MRSARESVPVDLGTPVWYVLGMTKKIAVSLPDQALQRAKTAVRSGKAKSVSNYIALLIDQESASESFEEMIAGWLRDSGASAKDIRAAERRALVDFERAGLVTKGKLHEEARRKTG
jgi:Arc/MetJ-type ribon-helix-helix transcriptional regulator